MHTWKSAGTRGKDMLPFPFPLTELKQLNSRRAGKASSAMWFSDVYNSVNLAKEIDTSPGNHSTGYQVQGYFTLRFSGASWTEVEYTEAFINQHFFLSQQLNLPLEAFRKTGSWTILSDILGFEKKFFACILYCSESRHMDVKYLYQGLLTLTIKSFQVKPLTWHYKEEKKS